LEVVDGHGWWEVDSCHKTGLPKPHVHKLHHTHLKAKCKKTKHLSKF